MKQYKNYNTVYGLLHILYYSFCTRIFLSTILFCGYDEAINQNVSATILKLHPNFSVICDQEATSLIDPKECQNI